MFNVKDIVEDPHFDVNYEVGDWNLYIVVIRLVTFSIINLVIKI
jgi:hypothetical protein